MSVIVAPDHKDNTSSLVNVLRHFGDGIDATKGFFLKPNIVFPVRPTSGEITRPQIVRDLIGALRQSYGKVDIILGEGTAAGTLPAENFDVSGYSRLAEEMNVPLLDLNQVDQIPVPWEYGTIDIPRIALERVYINLPIMKESAAAIFSGAIKNQKGLISAHMKKKFHKMGLHGPLAALTRAVKPHLTILDMRNFFKKENFLLAGDNLLELDVLVMRILGSEEPEYIKLLKADMTGSEEPTIVGKQFLKFGRYTLSNQNFKEFMKLRLWSNPNACSLCRGIFKDLKRFRLHAFPSLLLVYSKLLTRSFVGTDFLFGKNPQFDPHARHIVCVGNCTKSLAVERGYRHIPGCPPKWGDLVRHL